ncbi:MAG: carboxyltransferase domain-containing protein [Pseudomonadota bacterium]
MTPPTSLDARPDWRAVPLGDGALHIEFGRTAKPAFQHRARALSRALGEADLPGLLDHLPSYAAVLVRYDPDRLAHGDLLAAVAELISRADTGTTAGTAWRVPVCYDPAVAEDIGEAADVLGISVDALVRAHTGTRFEIALYGFAPGWAYLAGCPDSLNLPRREKPRPPTPDDAVMIAGGQAMITARAMPTGWYVIGRIAQPTLQLEADPPVCFDVGDSVQFDAVGLDDWRALYARACAGERVATPL